MPVPVRDSAAKREAGAARNRKTPSGDAKHQKHAAGRERASQSHGPNGHGPLHLSPPLALPCPALSGSGPPLLALLKISPPTSSRVGDSLQFPPHPATSSLHDGVAAALAAGKWPTTRGRTVAWITEGFLRGPASPRAREPHAHLTGPRLFTGAHLRLSFEAERLYVINELGPARQVLHGVL
ncbi:hypothetical protein JDV02_008962 [Purpureocillium takamizusanense]|uniref:Uncharacterized protein n=1 Tax=Purpureocillium takamizusanense TaxID=2060973 RepID=A0A9Q8QL61_9HYPO|nr:uncharacterized protein JDV02_008962 [Purpureocillium takamizusanense]UNI23124.1 hypothetical protein JDV02_008962 [Purpureocillium takamizusanense]